MKKMLAFVRFVAIAQGFMSEKDCASVPKPSISSPLSMSPTDSERKACKRNTIAGHNKSFRQENNRSNIGNRKK